MYSSMHWAGGVCPGESLPGGSRVSAQGGVCMGGVCQWVSAQERGCQPRRGGVCPEGSVCVEGCLSEGVSAQGGGVYQIAPSHCEQND